jgi:hypothetical protein
VKVSPDQEGRGLPARHQYAEILDELLYADERLAFIATGEDYRRERIHEDQSRLAFLDFRDDSLQHPGDIARSRVFGKIDEADTAVELVEVEEVELLLVAQHFQRRLTNCREVECRAFGRCQRKHDLVRQGGLAATRQTGDEVEGELRQAAPEHFVQPRHAGS